MKPYFGAIIFSNAIALQNTLEQTHYKLYSNNRFFLAIEKGGTNEAETINTGQLLPCGQRGILPR